MTYEELRERVAQLETALQYGADFASYRLAQLERERDLLMARIVALETKPDVVTRAMGPGAWVKISLAVALIIVTLMAGGDIGAAIKAARMGIG